MAALASPLLIKAGGGDVLRMDGKNFFKPRLNGYCLSFPALEMEPRTSGKLGQLYYIQPTAYLSSLKPQYKSTINLKPVSDSLHPKLCVNLIALLWT